jgi:hypothetical protein
VEFRQNGMNGMNGMNGRNEGNGEEYGRDEYIVSVHAYAGVVLILIGNAFASFILCYSSHSSHSVKKSPRDVCGAESVGSPSTHFEEGVCLI